MKRPAIAYWLVPADPVRGFFERIIVDLARRHDAPVFEPHMTIHVGLDRLDVAEEAIAQAVNCRGPVRAKALGISHSSEFTKTLFIQFELNAELSCLNAIIRNAAQDSVDYQLKPHLSLLYKKMSLPVRRRLAHSIRLPFSHVVFNSIKAVRCVLPTRRRGDVEAWGVVAVKSLQS